MTNALQNNDLSDTSPVATEFDWLRATVVVYT